VTQPDYVPVAVGAQVRVTERLPPAHAWMADRPAEIRGRAPSGSKFGSPGPDLGYGLKLARMFVDRLVLQPGEHAEDAVAGCFAVGSRRASIFGRAPVIYDMELAYTLWGFLPGAPQDLIAFRLPLFKGASHHYWDQREIVDRVLESTLRLSPADVASRLGEWRSLLRTD
jgi:hypothetical protein